MPSPRLLIGLPLFIAPAAIAGWLWLTMLSPFTYERPDHLGPISDGPHRVFVYGTLTHAPIRWLVYGRAGDPDPVVLEGFRRTGLDLAPAPTARVEGLLLRVDAEELSRLDRYERLGIRYERVRLTLRDGTQAWVYRRLPEDAVEAPE
ncbi:gamma-glutamylcyclotransferase family protein [Halomonas saccharevitans]|uniref:Gamma-glutamylcyclotransferase family protein n=1 Tax=Halomonas saccharevitans TaxID=416872 RepID=A0ABU3NAG5_9GAMM|nr:gamma-glutamylcyclotransferase family protein [Halomonas saccharevitans]MDT8878199.1 gamma-glutamylcyclotransferase family protein [Halomonas saccharevitans]